MNLFSNSLKKAKRQTESLVKRSTDKHIRLAVTGLSGAGKTAFITGLVNQLLKSGYPNKGANLPLWQLSREQRLLGVERELQPDLAIPSFNYQSAMHSLTQSPSRWPESTRNISQIRLAIHYQPESGIISKFTDKAKLLVDIIDYPGEWLLDLPLLDLSFSQWCLQQQKRMSILKNSPLFTEFEQQAGQIKLVDEVDARGIEKAAKLYHQLLNDLVDNQGFYLAQPGRMILPGELEGSPLLTWFPIMGVSESELADLEKSATKNSNFAVLKTRYQAYVSNVVKPFYKDHFCHFDRQIVLIDSLSALNRGAAQVNDMSDALSQILKSYQFGQSNILKRLFSPKIDKLLFAASKVDHITRDQQANLLCLLNDMLASSQQFAAIKGCQVETMAISAIKATKHGMVQSDGNDIEVVKGRNLTGEAITIYPGEVPKRLPNMAFWQQQGFNFTQFSPPQDIEQLNDPQLEHIRLDHLLQFLLGDKLE
ncbi:MAG: YcjX family protein [Parashewanella sp.]